MAVDVQYFGDVSPRAETGVVQFGDDWPGVFVRGDNALAHRFALEEVMRAARAGGVDPFSLLQVEGLSQLLGSCMATSVRDPGGG